MENIKNSIPCRTDGSVHGSKDPQDSYGRSFSGWKVRTRAEHHRLHYGSRSWLCSFCAAVTGGCKKIFKASSCSDDQRQQSAQEQSPGRKRERLNQYSAAEVIPRRNANHHRIKQCQRTQEQRAYVLRLPPFGGECFKFLQILRNFLYNDLQYNHSFLKRVDHTGEVSRRYRRINKIVCQLILHRLPYLGGKQFVRVFIHQK